MTGRPASVYVAVVGPGESARASDIAHAREIGALIAERGWITLTGGRAAGVMAAAAEGAVSKGGIALGLLPGSDRSQAAPALTASIPTGLGEARNAVLVTAADGVIACGLNSGTASEIALAIKALRPTVLVHAEGVAASFFAALASDRLYLAASPSEGMTWLADRFASTG